MSHRTNTLRIKAVYNALGPLQKHVVFVGGATVSLYADRMAEEVRPTDDVDILIELWTYKEFAAIEEKLRSLGFEDDRESGIICRYRIKDVTVDILTTGTDVLGFSNKWYPEGFANATGYKIDDKTSIKICSSLYFIATKLEAFRSPSRKDNNNGLYSSDFEDIVFVLENRSSIWEEFNNASGNLKKYLQKEFGKLLETPFFQEWVDAHTAFGTPSVTPYIIDQLKSFVSHSS